MHDIPAKYVPLGNFLLFVLAVTVGPIFLRRAYWTVRYLIPHVGHWTRFVKSTAKELGLKLWVYEPGAPKDFNVLASDDGCVEMSLQRSRLGPYRRRGDFGPPSVLRDRVMFHIILRFASTDQEALEKLHTDLSALVNDFRWSTRKKIDIGIFHLVRDPAGLSVVLDPPMYRRSTHLRLKQLYEAAIIRGRTTLHSDASGAERHLKILKVWNPDRASGYRLD